MLVPTRRTEWGGNVYAESACGIYVGTPVASELQLGRDTHFRAFA